MFIMTIALIESSRAQSKEAPTPPQRDPYYLRRVTVKPSSSENGQQSFDNPTLRQCNTGLSKIDRIGHFFFSS